MKNETPHTTTLTTPNHPDPVALIQLKAGQLKTHLQKLSADIHTASIYASALAERELHDRKAMIALTAIANTNRQLIHEMQITLSEHAKILIQTREGIEELSTYVRLAKPSNDHDVSSKESSDG